MGSVVLIRKNMYSGGENVQMNGDTPHDGGHGGGGHADCEELQRTGRYLIDSSVVHDEVPLWSEFPFIFLSVLCYWFLWSVSQHRFMVCYSHRCLGCSSEWMENLCP